MSISDSELRSLQATEKRYKKSCGDSLCVVVEPISKGGGKSFVGRMRFPPGRKSPVVDVRIGVYGKGVGKWSLREAREEWSAIRTWSRENGKDPRERKREQKALLVQKTKSPTLEQACESFLSDWTSANERGRGNTGISSGIRFCLSSVRRHRWSTFPGNTGIQEGRALGNS